MDGLDDYTSKLESFEDVIAWKKKVSVSVDFVQKSNTDFCLIRFISFLVGW